MSQPQSTLAVIFVATALTYPNIGKALQRAGWEVRAVEQNDGSAMAAAHMLVVEECTNLPSSRPDQLLAAVVDGAEDVACAADLRIDPSQPIAQMAEEFRLWLPPDMSSLARMEALFGRHALLPVVQGLHAELAQAVAGTTMPDAHKLAGLAGTLGFATASASWQAVDRGTGEQAAALRDSRTALIAIDRWLAEDT
jgi:hypothetical protein